MYLWPIHPKPNDDELLSSWITRIATANQLKTADFCSLALPGSRTTLKEIDRTHLPELMQVLADKTGTPIEHIRETSLLVDEGYVFLYRQYGATEWILPTANEGVNKGLAFCPQCLTDDAEPYYRKSWRFAFNPVCPIHRTLLMQCCPRCKTPHHFLNSARPMIGRSPIITCRRCKADIRAVTNIPLHPSFCDRMLSIQDSLRVGINNDSFDVPGYGHVRSLPYLRMLHATMHILGKPSLASWVIRHYRGYLPQGIDMSMLENAKLVETRSMENLSVQLCLAITLMDEWPTRLGYFANKNEISGRSFYTNRIAPFWASKAVSEFCPSESSPVSEEETVNARQLLRAKLGRRETPSELRSFMSDGIARSLLKVSQAKRRNVELSAKHFKLEGTDPNHDMTMSKRASQARKLMEIPAEQLARIAVLRRPQQKKQEVVQPTQQDLFVKIDG